MVGASRSFNSGYSLPYYPSRLDGRTGRFNATTDRSAWNGEAQQRCSLPESIIKIPDIYVVPVNDAIEHEEHRGCWCRPSVTEDEGASAVVVHHSADGRERAELDALPPATRH